MTVGELQDRMSQQEFVQWAAFLKFRYDEEQKAMEKAKQ